MSASIPFLAFALSLPAAETKSAYPRPELLMEVADLAKAGAAGRYLIFDARAKAAYREGHVPSAVWIDQATWNRTFQEGKDRDDWAKRISELGIDDKKPIVIYANAKSVDAARIWWILRYWGVRDARLLNGGWDAWKAANGKIEKEANRPRPVEFKPMPQSKRLSTKKQLLDLLKDKPPQIVDARSLNEYCGIAEKAKRNGAIPGARHLEWTDTLDKDGRFKNAEQLAKLLKEAGIDPSKPAIAYCQSGGRASVLAFTLELMGGNDVRNYYRSWAEWGNDKDTPIVRPKKK
jgi:thiosulfate/3-mercaptopyruvate sulfurtransferase